MIDEAERLGGELSWIARFTPATRAAADALPRLDGERLLVTCHLDAKMVGYFAGVVAAGAQVWACAANPLTTRDAVVDHLAGLGVRVTARFGDPTDRNAAALHAALAAEPTLLVEMGADASVAGNGRAPSVRGALEATGTGIDRLAALGLAYPVFDLDGLALKQRLHNRHLVGLMAMTTFVALTGLSLHSKRVLVVGYGPVGRGIADAARAFGAAVTVCDPDPTARLAAGYRGYPTSSLAAGLATSQVVLTATGVDGAIRFEDLAACPDGVFLANLGHSNTELPVDELRAHAVEVPRPGVEVCVVGGRVRYLLTGGAMLNLAGGPGDPYDTFDLITALLLDATAFLATDGHRYPPGLHPLPATVADRTARRVIGEA
ncbi:MAG: NAD(P)-dependent oxidoreductase [Egibacteraceae bacterium]